MNKFVLTLCFIIVLLSLVMISCSSTGNTDFKKVKEIIPSGDENYLVNNSDYIFDQNILHTFELNLPESNLAEIDADPVAEKYVEGSLTFNGETISPVGIRYKGSIGAFVNALSRNNLFNPGGFKTSTKLSMKVKINWLDSDTTFYRLKKLQFHSQNLDPTQMHERLGYWLFREMGVPAPRSVHARLIINGIYSGLYALTEQIDGRFARYNFSDGTGNIYKEVWPLDMNGQPHPEYFYINALKTNEDENPSVVLIQSFAKEIAASNSGSIQDVILKWMDVKEIISFAVVDRVIRNDDGPFHWYYIEENYWNHNYYWYEDPTKKRFHLIPWDLDNAFENLTSTINSVTCIADDWGEITNDGNPFPFGAYSFQQRSAASEKLTAGWVTFKSEYKQYLINFLEDPFSESQINSQLDKWTEQIRAATIEASQMYYDAISVYKWENSLTNLKAQLDVVREKFAKKIQ